MYTAPAVNIAAGHGIGSKAHLEVMSKKTNKGCISLSFSNNYCLQAVHYLTKKIVL